MVCASAGVWAFLFLDVSFLWNCVFLINFIVRKKRTYEK